MSLESEIFSLRSAIMKAKKQMKVEEEEEE